MILPHLRLLCHSFFFFFFNDTATTEIYTLSLHDALPISGAATAGQQALEAGRSAASTATNAATGAARSEEHTSELQSPCNLVCRLLLEKKKTPTVTSRITRVTELSSPTRSC